MTEKAKVDSRFIINLKGKDFVTYEGLLDTAHQMGLISIKTEHIQFPSKENGNRCIMKAIATTKDGGCYEGYGDADNTNAGQHIFPHLIRMAETRAKARALRDLTNIGMTAIEELAGEDDITENKHPNNTPKETSKEQSYKCIDCGAEINQAVYTYSTNKLGKALCRECQKKYKK